MVTTEDMRVPPTLAEGESVELVVSGRVDALLRDDVVLVATDERLVVSPKRGRSVAGFEGEYGSVSIPHEDVAIVRRSGLLQHRLEVVTTESRVFELPALARGDATDLVALLVDACDLERTAYGRPDGERQIGRTAIGVLTIALAAIGVLAGVGLAVVGIGLMLTFVGFFLGLFLTLVGGLVTWGSWAVARLTALWAFGATAEWRDEERRGPPLVEEPPATREG